jgi:hypothetical protein
MVVPGLRGNSLGYVAAAVNVSFWGGDYPAPACVSSVGSTQK